MKISFYLLMAAVMFGLFSSCSEESAVIEQESIQFHFTANDPDNEGGRLSTDFPEGVKVILSLTTSSGDPVLTHHTINLLKFGDSYISEPLMLNVGRYSISDFFVVSPASEILYATPRKGSQLAPAVEHSLPYGFVVSKDKVKDVNMQVIDARRNGPEKFGYASFGVGIINPLPIAVFIEQDGASVVTTAKLYLYQENTIKQEADLDAKINYVPFKLYTDVLTRLVISKEGYTSYIKVFTYDELIDELGSDVLNVVLTPASPSFSFYDSEYVNNSISFNGQGSIVIHWPDGEEYVEFGNPDDVASFSKNLFHNYTSATSDRDVSITGDLDKISGISFVYPSAMDVTNLPSLEFIFLQEGSLTLDLTANTALNLLNLIGTSGTVTLPESHALSNVALQDDVSDPNYIIQNVYSNAVSKNITAGIFSIAGLADRSVVTKESLDKIYDLQNTYGWSVEAW